MQAKTFTFTLPPNAEKIYDDKNGYHFLVGKTEYMFRYFTPLPEDNPEWKYFTNDREVYWSEENNNWIINPARTFIYTRTR